MKRAVILGGLGVVGRTIALDLAERGWFVDVTARRPNRIPSELIERGVLAHAIAHDDTSATRALIGSGADLIVDCVCFTESDASQLLPLLSDAGSSVMLSSRAVYVDAQGRHVNSSVKPQFPGPVTEDQPTMAAGDGDFNSRDGYGANKVAAENYLLDSGLPVSIIRASKVHGAGASPAREWHFVKRILDGRECLILDGGGRSIDHTTAAANIASLVRAIESKPGARILNCADPDALSISEIADVIAKSFNFRWKNLQLIEGEAEGVGHTPWSTPYPFVLDVNAARKLGYAPAGTYSETINQELAWITAELANNTEAAAANFGLHDSAFNYVAEDNYLKHLSSG